MKAEGKKKTGTEEGKKTRNTEEDLGVKRWKRKIKMKEAGRERRKGKEMRR